MVHNEWSKKNIGSFSLEQQEKIALTRVLIIGCGGSGYIVDQLARIGIMHIGFVDGDIFEISNMNRQMLCNSGNIGKNKALCAQDYFCNINGLAEVNAYPVFINGENSDDIISKYDIVLDCTDNPESKILIENSCNRSGIPLIFGGMSQWVCQVGISFPNDLYVSKIFTRAIRMRKDLSKKTDTSFASTTSCINCFTSALYVRLLIDAVINRDNKKCVFLFDIDKKIVGHYNPNNRVYFHIRRW